MGSCPRAMGAQAQEYPLQRVPDVLARVYYYPAFSKAGVLGSHLEIPLLRYHRAPKSP